MRPRIAFYAPLKSPDHPVPSGDRTVARLYWRALEEAGFEVVLASRLRSFEGRGDPLAQAMLLEMAAAERLRVRASLKAAPPALWFSYHCHYKAPDLLGPDGAAMLGIPYVIAEPSHAPKRAGGGWATFHAASAAAISAADLAIVSTGQDLPCVTALRGERPTLHLPPFLDARELPQLPRAASDGPLRLITVAMMRAGDKLASYRLLSEALALLGACDWRLTIVGDGSMRPEVECLFRPFGDRVAFTGLIEDRKRLAAHLAGCDLFVWPAVNEAYGMALLEAQAMGLPVLAGREGGVADVLRDGETGVLVAPRDAGALAAAIAEMARDRALALRMGAAAQAFAREARSLSAATALLHAAITPLIEGRRCAS